MPSNPTRRTPLRFHAENLAGIEKGEFEQKPLTLFCGPNNSGKTWVMYSLYHFYRFIPRHARQHLYGLHEDVARTTTKNLVQESAETEISLERFNRRLTKDLPQVFNVKKDDLKNSFFKFDATEEQFQKILKQGRQGGQGAFLIPAERKGLHLFFRELRATRTTLLHHASKEDANLNHLLRDVVRSPYSVVIADYIDWLNRMHLTKKESNGEFHQFAKKINKLIDGVYRVDNDGRIDFKPYQGKRKQKTKYAGLHLSSGAVKSLFGLWFYLKYQAQAGDVLMIDEPELNLHPQNQIQIARLLAQLVNAGLKVVISTHSDYIIKEFNTLIMLSQDHKRKLRRKYKYDDNEILQTEQVGAYLFDGQTITPFEISPDDGIYATTFDEVIAKMNDTNNDIYYSIQESKQE